MVEICPHCQQRFTRALHSGDFVPACTSGDQSLDQEDVKVIGNWTDYTGSGKVNASFPAIPTTNELDATDAGVRGGRFTGVTDRGARKQVNRQRQHLEYIPSKGKEC